VHTALDISVPADATNDLVSELQQREGVVSLSVQHGESVKPPGDVLSLVVLNGDVDAVLARVQRVERLGPVSVTSSTVDSLIDTEQHESARLDVDEATWEDAETAMRRHTRPTANFYLTTAGGGLAAACALVAPSRVTEATALVAAAIIAPVFEPLARIALAVVNRHRVLTMRALGSALLGYAILVAVAVVAMLVLRTGDHGFVTDFSHNTTRHEIDHFPLINLILSAIGAVTGVVMVSAGRFTQLAGPLVALQLLPAAATLGYALELGRWHPALDSLGRLGIDVAMVLIAGVIVFAYKHVQVHQRRAIAH
jgi:uncharacterized membrane protein